MRLVGAMLCGMALAVTPASGGDEPADDDFLEFLGSFDDGEGNWFDPLTLLEYEDSRHGRRDARRVHDKKPASGDQDETGAENEENDEE